MVAEVVTVTRRADAVQVRVDVSTSTQPLVVALRPVQLRATARVLRRRG
jgi:hypothetical protein